MHTEIGHSSVVRSCLWRILEIPQLLLSQVDKRHDLVVVLFEGGPVNLGLVSLRKHFEILVNILLRVVEELEIVRVLLLEPHVVLEVEVDDPVEVVVALINTAFLSP